MPSADPILEAANRWCGVPYGHPRSRKDTSVIDCSTLTAHVLDALYGPLPPDIWADLVVADARRPWSPIEVVRDLWGNEVTEPYPNRWHLIQGWRRLPGGVRPASGHAMLAWCDEEYPGVHRLCVLEAQTGTGVRWRGSWIAAVAPLDLDTATPFPWPSIVSSYTAGARIAVLGSVPS